jgi:hypothetical protein
MSSSVAYLVMPPGHGKSYLQARIPNLLEADTLTPNKATPLLRELREEAKRGQDWAHYDREWTRELKTRIPLGRWVVMVPAREVGVEAGWVYLGTLVLERTQWVSNFMKRPDSWEKHIKCRERALEEGGILLATNGEMEERVRQEVEGWIQGEE